jgi:hypothetical protein
MVIASFMPILEQSQSTLFSVSALESYVPLSTLRPLVE